MLALSLLDRSEPSSGKAEAEAGVVVLVAAVATLQLRGELWIAADVHR